MSTSSGDPIRDQARARKFWEDRLTSDAEARELPTGEWASLPEHELMGIIIELGRRSNICRFAIRNGTATADHRLLLDELLELYRRLALAVRPENLAVTSDRVGQETGQVMEMMADVAASLGDEDGAIAVIRAAVSHYREVGSASDADRCERRLLEAELRAGNRGAELVAEIGAKLAQTAPGLDRGEALIDLAEVHIDSGEFHDATALLRAAEGELEPHRELIRGASVGDAFASMLVGGEAAPLAGALRVRSLFRRLWIGLSVVLDDDDEAERYVEQFDRLDRTESEGDQDSADFTARAMEALRQQWRDEHGTEPPDPASSLFSEELDRERARYMRGEMDDG